MWITKGGAAAGVVGYVLNFNALRFSPESRDSVLENVVYRSSLEAQRRATACRTRPLNTV